MQIEDIRNIALWLFFYAIGGSFVFFVYWNILYFYLTRKYDRKLFKQPFFNASELGVYSSWPFSLVRATAYILLITNSSIAKKRFKDLNEPVIEIKLVKVLCQLWKISLFIIAVMFLLGMLWGGIDMLFLSEQ